MLLINISVLLFYLFWGILSVFAQGENYLKKKAKAHDLLNIIPNYKFFCPRPTRYDYHLYYRHKLPGTGEGEWKEISIGKRNLLTGFMWNPTKRDRKIFYKTVSIIQKKIPAQEKVRVRSHLPVIG